MRNLTGRDSSSLAADHAQNGSSVNSRTAPDRVLTERSRIWCKLGIIVASNVQDKTFQGTDLCTLLRGAEREVTTLPMSSKEAGVPSGMLCLSACNAKAYFFTWIRHGGHMTKVGR